MGYKPNMSHFEDSHDLPELYWDVMSSEQRIHAICRLLDDICKELVGVHVDISKIVEDITELQELFAKFVESGFDDYYAEQVARWIDEHLRYVFETVAKQVYFGLTDDGYFCAYVPDGWEDIIFDTGAVYGSPSYGRLILRFEVDGARGVIDNTGYGKGIGLDVARELQSQLERLNKTCYVNLKERE